MENNIKMLEKRFRAGKDRVIGNIYENPELIL